MKRGAPPTSAKGFLLTLTSWRTRLGRALLFSALLSLSMPPWPTKVQAGYFYDSDGDGFDDTYVPDPWEDTAYYGYTTPPSDQDGDGWEDSLDPFPFDARLNPQTDPDADGVPSELEWFYGMNDLDPADGAADLDGDGFSNAEAFQQGWPLDAASLAFPDADGDRLNDIIEQHWALLHPGSLDPGNPLDPVADYDQDGVMNFEELTWGLDLASPTSPATGEDLAFMQLVTGNFSAFVPPGYPGYSATDPDADGLPSLLEYQLQLNPRSADSDEDGVPDGEEDTDGDGFGNLAEVAAGTLPGQAASHPVASSPDGTGGAGAGSGSTSGTGNEQGNGTGTTGSAAPPVGGTALAATTDLHLRVRSLKVSGGTITRHSQDEWIYSSGMGTSSEEMAAMKANGWDISDAFTMDIPTGTDPDGLPTGYETRYWWTAKKQVGVAGETILPFSGRSGELASDQAVSEAYADEPGQVYQGDVSGELNLNDPASGDVFTGSEEGGGVKVVSEFAASKQSTPVSDTGLYPQGEAAEVWVEGSASDVAQRRTYLILTSSTALQAEPNWQGVGTVTFILEPGLTGVGRVETMTGAAPWVTVHNGRLWVEPPVQEGMRNEVRLLPVDIAVVFGFQWENSGRQRLNAKLQARAEQTIVNGNTSIFLVRAAAANGQQGKLWVVQTACDEAAIKSALASVPYVAFEGHANMGIGPAFDAAGIIKISDFTNFGNANAAINWVYMIDHEYPNFKTITDPEIPTTVANYNVLPAKINLERYPNNEGVAPGSNFTVHAPAWWNLWLSAKYHFTRGSGSKFLVVDAGKADLPALGYQTFFYNACNTSRDFGEVFQHGRVFHSNVSIYPDGNLAHGSATDKFVFGVIDGQAEGDMLKSMNDTQIGLPEIDPTKPSYRVVQY